jgi:hypothetical protein
MGIRLAIMRAAVGAVALAPVMASAAQPIGFVEASGSTFISRDGKLVSVTQKSPLFAGDRVLTRGKGSAKVNMASGCSVAVPQTSVLTVGTNSCTTGASGFVERAGAPMGQANALKGGSLVIALLAVGAAGLGVAAAVSTDDDDAVSP